MRKRLLCAVAALLLLNSAALAETYSGTVAATETISVEAGASGILDTLNVLPGSYVQAGDVLGTVGATKVFATQDGTVAEISCEAGDTVNGTVLEVNPSEKYRIYCTVDEAYESAETMLVHSGEQVYIQCTKNGTHCATGVIGALDGSEYQVITTGGELYVGETVYLYRDAEFSSEQRIGIGTVVETDTQSYSAQGTLVAMHVQAGETVERGELLYEYADGDETTITAQADGIVLSVGIEQGDSVEEGAAIMTIAKTDGLCVEVDVDETFAATINEGNTVNLIYIADTTETPVAGTITDISDITENGMYTVRIQPEKTDEIRIGMTAEVNF